MVNWLLVVKVVVLVSLPSLLLLCALSFNTQQSGQGDQFTTESTHIHSPPEATPPRPHPQSHPPPSPLEDAQRLVLITGSAGFIGYHISHVLAEQWGASTVVGLDNFNDYYDVQLKKDRTNELIRAGVRIYRGDVCDSTLLSHLFSKYRFTDVVHLAAQAGVRHSLKKPVDYIQANVQCFLTLLDTITHHKVATAGAAAAPKLIFASSSSVYGEGASLPFSPSSPPCPTTNVYAASKLANEQFAEAYCTEHGIRTIGLRFFTVYGPWGRPDMAVYKFAKQISEGLPVPMFDSPQPLKRDFTFVNDTVGGVLAALRYTPTRCGEIYNVGTGQPLTLDTMLKHLEEELQTPAKIELLPMPPSDLQSTYADISETRRVLNFSPTVSLKEGIHEFVAWFKWYSNKNRSSSRKKIKFSAKLEAALEVGEREVADARFSRLQQTNSAYRERINTLRGRYEKFAEERGREVQNTKKSGFIFYAGVDSPGGTVIRAPGYRGDIKVLREQCLATEQCIAFNTMAELKNKLQPQHMWTRTAEGEGLYVADINMCESDLHDCDRYADCVHEGPASYSCSCHRGYVKLGRKCVEKYTESKVNDVEWVWQISDHLEGLSWDRLVEGRPFTFIQGLDSPGGDYMVVEGEAGNPERLKEVCSHTHHCVAFNTNGILKYSLLPPYKWMRWTDHPQHGLYVRDINYCALDLEECPAHSHCYRHAPANYSCVCEPPYSLKTDKDNNINNAMCIRKSKPDLIHIIVSVDHEHFPGLLGVVNSALSHASQPERLKFHIVLSGVEESVLRSYLGCYGYKDHPQLEVTKLNTDWLKGRIKVYTDVGRVGNLASLANFGRFLFHEHFPELSRAVYLDADTVVLGDVDEFWRRLLTTDQLLLAIPRKTPSYGNIFRGSVKDKFHKRYGYVFEDSDPTFNAGVYGVNFDLWRSKNMHREVQYWLEEQAREPLWEFGTQPIMLLVAYRQWEKLGWEWNIQGLGWKRQVGEEVLSSAKLLHWNGKGKPWLEEGLHRDLWLPFLPWECSGCGSCTATSTSDRDVHNYFCLCREGCTGINCEINSSKAL